ncbi:isoprenoid synthase domain-containing protein [Boletus edulis]|uniref:(2E,6E)-farnesyl diphosphate synthase n=1 Tax=Boletus edulis BED1 TaxID=1328754 RepID=A0AAD4GBU1_BOLED|nr:isoprenoid synthase domain-containing protein [Boletus edulis]KAF8435158.1 putative farnesyltranstransferase [Boletus edulis BED1]
MHHPFIDSILSSLSMPSPQLSVEEEADLLEPYTYIASCPGKGFRSQFIKAFNHWLRVPPAQLEAIVRIVELLHNASLLVDDIEDNSELRRGKPVAHKIYGVPQTINSANYAYFLAYQEVSKIPCMDQVARPCILYVGLHRRNSYNSGPRFVQILNDEMLALHRGQGRDIFWRDHVQCPTEEEYIEMVKDKTGGLLRIAVRLMMECATIQTGINYVPLVNLLGIWFQIRDDYMNLQSNAYTEHKGFAEDLSEGKFSFPIIHGIRGKRDSKYIINTLRLRPNDPMLKRLAISFLNEVTHSFEYTLSVLDSLEAQAHAEVTRLGGNPKLEAILDKLTVKASGL